MLHIPKDHVKDNLETAVLFLLSYPINIDALMTTTKAKKKVLLTASNVAMKNRHFFYFDKVITVKDVSDYKEILEGVRSNINDPQKTRIAIASCFDSEIAARVRQELDIPGPKPDYIKRFIDKDLFKKRLIGSTIRMPKHVLVDREALNKNPKAYGEFLKKEIGIPMFCKRTFSTAGKGYVKVLTEEDLTKALDVMGNAEMDYEVEEFIDSKVISIDYVVVQDEIVYLGVVRHLYPLAESHQGKPVNTISVPKNDPLYKKALVFAKDLVKAMAPAHDMSVNTEVFDTDKGLVLLEVNYRRGGNMTTVGYYIADGCNLESISFDLQWGTPIQIRKEDPEKPLGIYASTFEFISKPGKVVKRRELPEDLVSEIRMDWYYQKGFEYKSEPGKVDASAGAILLNKDIDQLWKDTKLMGEWEPYIYE